MSGTGVPRPSTPTAAAHGGTTRIDRRRDHGGERHCLRIRHGPPVRAVRRIDTGRRTGISRTSPQDRALLPEGSGEADMRRRAMMGAAAAGLAGAVAAAADGARSTAAGKPFPLDRLKLVSLSHVNDPAPTNVFPGDPPFELETIATIEKDGYYLQFVREGEHTGTHWGAPGHFNAGEPLADDLDLEDLFLPAVKIDVRQQSAKNADYEVTIADIKAWERRHGRIADESMVITWTGWEYRWTDAKAWYNYDADGVMHQPGFSLDAANWLIETGRLGHRGGT